MKLLLLYGALLTAAAAISASAGVPAHAKATSKVAVFFNRTTTFAQLASIKQDVLKDGITLSYDQLEFDKSGNLLKIRFHVHCLDGVSGSAMTDTLPEDFSFGFVRDFTPGAAKALQIGNFK